MDLTASGILKANARSKFSGLLVANNVAINTIKTPFTPSLNLQVADFAYSTFGGYAAVIGSAPNAAVWHDTVTNARSYVITVAAANFTIVASGANPLPETIYGGVIQDGVTGAIYGSFNYQTPVPIIAGGDGVLTPNQLVSFFADFMV